MLLLLSSQNFLRMYLLSTHDVLPVGHVEMELSEAFITLSGTQYLMFVCLKRLLKLELKELNGSRQSVKITQEERSYKHCYFVMHKICNT